MASGAALAWPAATTGEDAPRGVTSTFASIEPADAPAHDAEWAALMARAQGGDRGAYRDLPECVAPVIAAYCRRVFPEPAQVEDCVQEALLVLHRVRNTHDPARPFRPWLFTLVRHSAIDMLRRQRRLQEHEISDDGATAETAAPSSLPDVPGASVIDELAVKYRDALRLAKLDGHSMREAARRLGISEVALHARVHRGIALVRRRLDREEA